MRKFTLVQICDGIHPSIRLYHALYLPCTIYSSMMTSKRIMRNMHLWILWHSMLRMVSVVYKILFHYWYLSCNLILSLIIIFYSCSQCILHNPNVYSFHGIYSSEEISEKWSLSTSISSGSTEATTLVYQLWEGCWIFWGCRKSRAPCCKNARYAKFICHSY